MEDPRASKVGEQIARARKASTISLSGGLPASELLPRVTLAKASVEVLLNPSEIDPLQYGWPEGLEGIRRWVANRMNARGADIVPEDVVVGDGGQGVLSLFARTWAWLKRSEIAQGVPVRVAVDDETYASAIKEDVLGRFELVRSDEKADLRYLVYPISNPHGVDLVGPRREALLARGDHLLVDEAYGDLRFDGYTRRPMCADAPDRVWQVGSFSKVVGPGLRVGWLIPPRAYRQMVVDRRSGTSLQTGTFPQAVLARWLESNDYDDLVNRSRRLYSERAEQLVFSLRKRLPSWHVVPPEGGLTLWVETDLEGRDAEFIKYVSTYGVTVDPGSSYRAFPPISKRMALRLSFSQEPLVRLEEGVRRLAYAAKSFRRRGT
jgi:2-aminoadipate transaminase